MDNNSIYFDQDEFGPIYSNTTNTSVHRNIIGISILICSSVFFCTVLYCYNKDSIKQKSSYESI